MSSAARSAGQLGVLCRLQSNTFELDTALQPVVGLGLSACSPTAIPLERLGIAADTIADPLLAHEARLHEPVRCPLAGEAIRIPGLLVPRRELADVPERLGNMRHLERRRCCRRAASTRWKFGGIDVRSRCCASWPTATE